MTFAIRIRNAALTLMSVMALGLSGPAIQAQEPALSGVVPQGAPMSFADLIDQVSPAVVSIEASGTFDTEGQRDLEQLPPGMREFFERFGGAPRQQEPRERQSQGSGFLISAEGLVVTNNHVIEGADTVNVVFNDGESYAAEIIGTDVPTDLAVLRIQDTDQTFEYVTLDRDLDIRVGDWVFAVGNPFGLGGTATAGIVSALGRPININNSVYTDFIQTDASINRGNSGGPMFDLNGNVIGVNSVILSPTGGNVGIGFAIPSDLAATIVDQLLENGQVRRGYLGVLLQTLTDDLKDAMELDTDLNAVLVGSVYDDTPADEAGIEQGDLIVSLNGEEIEDQRTLTQQIGSYAPGERIRLGVIRDGEERTIQIRLGERPSDPNGQVRDSSQGDNGYFGMALGAASEEDRSRLNVDDGLGVLVEGVAPNSAASDEGIRPGDLILEADGEDIRTEAEFRSAVEAVQERGRPAVLVLVASQGGTRYAALKFETEED